MPHRPRKRFGQHFLHDPAVIARIVDAIDPRSDQQLIEIGPGLGAITLPLLQRAGVLTVVEIDRDAARTLAERAAALDGLKIVVGDALQTDFCALGGPGCVRIVGNLPYNISTPLLFHLLGQLDCITDMHFMLQKEVVTRMSASPGGKDYGRLTVMLALRCSVEPLFDIGAGAFKPPPRVVSSFVRLRPAPALWNRLQDPHKLETIVRAAFSARRKTLRRGLAGLVTSDAFEHAGIDAGERPQCLSPGQFVDLANACTSGAPGAL